MPLVHELAWLLSVVTPLGLLERAHSYKDKVAQGAEMTHGLFAYPVLMAADILLYHADAVPVGKDQKQHLEIARDIAQKFNDRFGPVFKIPEPFIREATAIVPGIDGRKMSKSYGNTLELFGDTKALEKKIMGIPTDSTPVADPKPVEGSILAQLMQTIGTPERYEAFTAKMRAGGCGYGDLKKELAEVAKEFLAPFQEKFMHYQSRPDEVETILRHGAERAPGPRAAGAGESARRHRTFPMDADESAALDARNPTHVKLPVFEGPLDLLLYLIKKDELDIYDIPIEQIHPALSRVPATDQDARPGSGGRISRGGGDAGLHQEPRAAAA